jgi:hypothetical protein
LQIQGEYYWNGTCAAAATPSTTKFNLTATDGAQIAVGDAILIRDGYADYVYSTVKATVNKGSNIWEIELNDALSTGNIGSACFYTITHTKIVSSGGIAIAPTLTSLSLIGLYIESNVSAIYCLNCFSIGILGCIIIASGNSTGVQLAGGGGSLSIKRSYTYCSTTGRPILCGANGGSITLGDGTTALTSEGCVLATGGNSTYGLYATGFAYLLVIGSIIDVNAGKGMTVTTLSQGYISDITISPTGRTAATVGVTVSMSYMRKGSNITNNATTPESGSVAAFAYIGA